MDMTQAMRQPDRDAPEKVMVFAIDGREYGIDIMSVREIRSWVTITPLPRTPDYISGVINIRGTVLPIINLAARLAPGVEHATVRDVIVVLEIGDRIAGILVDQVSDIVEIKAGDIQDLPSATTDSVREFVFGLLTHDGRVVCLLRSGELLPEPVAA